MHLQRDRGECSLRRVVVAMTARMGESEGASAAAAVISRSGGAGAAAAARVAPGRGSG